MSRKVVIFNGPPGSGKDFIVDELASIHWLGRELKSPDFPVNWPAIAAIPSALKMEFKYPLIELVKAFYELNVETAIHLMENKEKRFKVLHDKSWREAMIHVSETVIKPVFGQRIFGELGAKRLQFEDTLYLFSDSGFAPELEEITKEVDSENVFVIRLVRDGCDFSNDSRRYITTSKAEQLGVYIQDLENDSTYNVVEEALNQIELWLNTQTVNSNR